ncbi:sulfatase/phosphatase domain-containing protein [Prosthecobacter sp.]|uniref:sulfatase/phosphatase domain-containing protein n=1 Tax=Prosthecobacter sp. TaxID=1965333 RepID=UPI002488F12B|nr:sulfatase/phosphatase domain-containing protein [Prosthecobacter sp.]MDI1315640.1 DUF4976 domain-containing protein [Prosthecobacter sp.]
MAATIFAASGVTAPVDLDGKSLLQLLTNPHGQVRDFLPLFNFWGTDTAQSMAVVTPEWKYIYWYSAKDGMKPMDELFHLGHDEYEMQNVATEPNYARDLASMQKAYDTALAAIGSKVVSDHGYEHYSKLFDRSLTWEQKAPLIREVKEGEGESGGGSKIKRKKAGQ